MALFQLQPEESANPETDNSLRKQLLQQARRHFLRNGYHGTRINEVIESAGTTKGGFYHHFSSKQSLAQSLLDEIVRPEISRRWIKPVTDSTTPLASMVEVFQDNFSSLSPEDIQYGCILPRMAQDCTLENESFRLRVDGIYQLWIHEWSHSLEHLPGKDRKEIEQTCILLVSMVQGTWTMLRASQSSHILRSQLASALSIIQSLQE